MYWDTSPETWVIWSGVSLGVAFSSLEPRIDGLAFERQHSKDALVHSSERFPLDKPLQRFYAQSKFSQCQGSFRAETSGAKSFEMLRCGVFRAVDDPQILPTTGLHRRLYLRAILSGNHGTLIQPSLSDRLCQAEIKLVDCRVERVYVTFNCLSGCSIWLAFF